jgi:hypothetical protein
LTFIIVVFLAIDEHHHVGVLLDRARLAQVRQLRALVLAVLHLARQLGQRDDGMSSSLAMAFRPVVISETS